MFSRLDTIRKEFMKNCPPVNCPKCKARKSLPVGAMFLLQGSKMANFLNIFEYKCDKCGHKLAYKNTP